MLRYRSLWRNCALLMETLSQHLTDDPALLIVQVSRRLPLTLRARAGRLMMGAGRASRRGAGLAALGATMAGRPEKAVELLESAKRRCLKGASISRLAEEAAILLDRGDLVAAGAPSTTRARSEWSAGNLSEAVQCLEDSGGGGSRQAARYRSELRLLQPGVRLPKRPQPPNVVVSGAGAPSPFRVLHLITNSLPHTQSGYSLRTHNVLSALKDGGIESTALTRTGYPVMIGKPNARAIDFVDGIAYRRTLPPSLGATPEARLVQEVDAALAIAQDISPSIVHATTDYRNALVASAVSESTGIPWIYEVRGLMEQTWVASRGSAAAREAAYRSEKAQLLAAREGELAQSAAAVVTLSQTMASQLVARGVDPERITLVPNGIDESLLSENLDPESARRRVGLDLPQGAFAVGALSALVDYEGFDVLLEAAALILGTRGAPDSLKQRFHVVLVGDGTAAPHLAERARTLGISDRVHLPGQVPRKQARDWVQALDVVAVPRLDRMVSRSVTPQKPIEALALGRPVVLSDLPALRETVTAKDGSVHGDLVRPESPQALADALRLLAEDEGGRDRRAHDGRRLAAERTWPALMRRYEGVYRSVCDAAEREGQG